VSKYEGTGPGGGWDIHAMAEAIEHLQDAVINLTRQQDEMNKKLEDLALIAPGRSTAYLPRNRRT
jgi:hypothetical protein